MATDQYQNPLLERYASREMAYIFSPDFKFGTWRKLWVYLAEGEQREGLAISDEQIAEMKAHLADIDYDYAAKKEKEVRHDVMAHVHTFGKAAPKAAPIIHLGATSAYVADNTDLIQIKEGLLLLRKKILGTLWHFREFALKYAALPTLAFTHFQPAQPTTVGKRACLWMQDLLLDLRELDWTVSELPFLGSKGTTGTQASFLTLFDGDHEKIKRLEAYIAERAGFNKVLAVSGQTYTRKIDFRANALLSAIAQSAAKFAVDLRLLQHRKEIEEPFEKNQIGSSAMAYKRNPMRSERMGSLARFVIALSETTAATASTQWFERTLDDSANKRLSVAQAFLATDAILEIYQNVASGLVVYEKGIARHLDEELPFMLTEEILMEGVKKGGDRQKLHEEIRVLSMQAAEKVKMEGERNPLLELISKNPVFGLSLAELQKIAKPERTVGRSAEQTREFMSQEVDMVLKGFDPPAKSELKV